MTNEEKLQIAKRGFLLTQKAAPGLLLRRCAGQLMGVAEVYAGVYLAGLVVSAITEEKPMEQTLLAAGICVLGMFVLKLLNSLTAAKDHELEGKYDNNLKFFLSQKVMKMDYTKVEDPDTHRKKEIAEDMSTQRWEGVRILPFILKDSVCGLCEIVIGVFMCRKMLFVSGKEFTGLKYFICSPWFLIVLLLILLGTMFLDVKFSNIAKKIYAKCFTDKEYAQASRLRDYYEDYFTRHYQAGKEIRLYDQSEMILDESRKNITELMKFESNVGMTMARYTVLQELIGFLSGAAMYGFAILRGLSGLYTASQVVTFVMCFANINRGVTRLVEHITGILAADSENISRVFEFLDIPDEKYKGTFPTEKRSDNEYEFAFSHVWFQYPGSEDFVLKDVNLKWRIGEKMALVGVNGSGKSTLIKLLCRLYDPTRGEITLNGIDIRKYRYEEYMALFSVVFQDSGLWSFSVAENVACSTEYDPEKVEICVRKSGLSERLDRMSEGIQTCLYRDFDEKGVEISGGEAQKLCLARAIYKGAPFMILDEPTAALDPVSEYEIYTGFNRIVGTRTAIYISHRLSSCRFCDEITVMKEGRIVERGSHEKLLSQNGEYAALWSAQAEYYTECQGRNAAPDKKHRSLYSDNK